MVILEHCVLLLELKHNAMSSIKKKFRNLLGIVTACSHLKNVLKQACCNYQKQGVKQY